MTETQRRFQERWMHHLGHSAHSIIFADGEAGFHFARCDVDGWFCWMVSRAA